jgi:exportin-2 (importin alpha re-exporter)
MSRSANLQQYLKPILISLLTRLHANKTDKFAYLFAKFLLFMMAINVEGFTPDLVISTMEEIQPQYVAFLWVF